MIATEQILLFDSDPARAARIAALLERTQPATSRRSVTSFHDPRSVNDGPSAGTLDTQKGIPTLAVIVEGSVSAPAFPGLADSVRRQGVTTLGVIDTNGEPNEVARFVRGYDGWMALDSLERELPIRVASLLDPVDRQEARDRRLPSIDPRFLSVVIHDIRTPLNVIMLTIRAITQTVPDRSPELDEDLTFLKENAWQIEKMLLQLVEYGRLSDGEIRNSASEFDPRRFLSDLLEIHRSKAGAKAIPVNLEFVGSSPSEVSLDQSRALLALQQSLSNAVTAAGNTPVRLRSSGEAGRWIIELIVDKPPPEKVDSMTLRADAFERLEGAPGERRGLDLAIAARVSEVFGGSGKLIVEPGRRSTIVLDWPQRLPNG